MTQVAAGGGGTLAQWLGAEGIVLPAHDLGNVERVRALLIDAAQDGRALMRSLCDSCE